MSIGRVLSSLVVAVLSACLWLGQVRAQVEDQRQILSDAAEVLHEIQRIPEQAIPPRLLSRAGGIVIVPGMVKAGFLVGGAHGRGVVMVKNEGTGWSDPAFITLSAGSLGFQIGVQSTDVILVFKSSKSVENLANGKFTLGADANVAAGPVGRSAEAATDARLKSEIYSYSRSRGLFAGVSLEGSVLEIDAGANSAFYDSSDITAAAIFARRDTQPPVGVAVLKQELAKATELGE
ncbi:MAG: lipid-binding SYLF domain-containing protein [Chromatiales bacterium]|nr:lipid-binding SYLF domain-containing protein [Chromatiales bacterium]